LPVEAEPEPEVDEPLPDAGESEPDAGAPNRGPAPGSAAVAHESAVAPG